MIGRPLYSGNLGRQFGSARQACIAFPLDGHYIASVGSILLSERDERRAQACPCGWGETGPSIPMGTAVAVLPPRMCSSLSPRQGRVH